MNGSIVRRMKRSHQKSIAAYDHFFEFIEDMLLVSIVPDKMTGEFITLFLARYVK